MAKYGSPSFAVLLVDGYNMLSAKVQGAAEEIGVELEPSDGLGDSWREHTPTGMRTATLEQSGAFFDTSAAGMHAAMSGAPATERIVAWALAGNALGAIFNAVKGAFTSTYRVISTVGKLTKADVSYTVTGQLDEGFILTPYGPQTADWTGAAVDLGAASTGFSVVYLEVSAYSGFSAATVKVQTSPNGSLWVDLNTPIAITTAPSAVRQVITGSDRYARVIGDVTGSGSLTLAVGLIPTGT